MFSLLEYFCWTVFAEYLELFTVVAIYKNEPQIMAPVVERRVCREGFQFFCKLNKMLFCDWILTKYTWA
jgi:hypothetical protein